MIVTFDFGCAGLGVWKVHSVVLVSFWVVCILYSVNFSHTLLEVDFDERRTAMPLMRIASCTVDEYIAAETKGDAAAISVSVTCDETIRVLI